MYFIRTCICAIALNRNCWLTPSSSLSVNTMNSAGKKSYNIRCARYSYSVKEHSTRNEKKICMYSKIIRKNVPFSFRFLCGAFSFTLNSIHLFRFGFFFFSFFIFLFGSQIDQSGAFAKECTLLIIHVYYTHSQPKKEAKRKKSNEKNETPYLRYIRSDRNNLSSYSFASFCVYERVCVYISNTLHFDSITKSRSNNAGIIGGKSTITYYLYTVSSFFISFSIFIDSCVFYSVIFL